MGGGQEAPPLVLQLLLRSALHNGPVDPRMSLSLSGGTSLAGSLEGSRRRPGLGLDSEVQGAGPGGLGQGGGEDRSPGPSQTGPAAPLPTPRAPCNPCSFTGFEPETSPAAFHGLFSVRLDVVCRVAPDSWPVRSQNSDSECRTAPFRAVRRPGL